LYNSINHLNEKAIVYFAIANTEMEGIYLKEAKEDQGGDRQDVTNAFCSQKIMQYIKDNGIELISFKQAWDAAGK